jgi:hypothetical protein
VVPVQPIGELDAGRQKERFEWWAGAGQERRLIPQERALYDIGPMSAPGLETKLNVHRERSDIFERGYDLSVEATQRHNGRRLFRAD